MSDGTSGGRTEPLVDEDPRHRGARRGGARQPPVPPGGRGDEPGRRPGTARTDRTGSRVPGVPCSSKRASAERCGTPRWRRATGDRPGTPSTSCKARCRWCSVRPGPPPCSSCCDWPTATPVPAGDRGVRGLPAAGGGPGGHAGDRGARVARAARQARPAPAPPGADARHGRVPVTSPPSRTRGHPEAERRGRGCCPAVERSRRHVRSVPTAEGQVRSRMSLTQHTRGPWRPCAGSGNHGRRGTSATREAWPGVRVRPRTAWSCRRPRPGAGR